MKVRPWTVRPDFRLTAQVMAGRYRLDDLLGRGGGADVYEALDLRLRRPVAVKVLRPEGEAPTEERFDSEARLLARLQHPGLVTVYDCGREDGQPYLVMELIRGTTLRRRISRAPLTPAEACRIGAALASALAHVHAAGVVHRDVKPSNILLDESGAPYLTDFGISRLLDSTARTVTGVLVGTAAYMAPEQVLGKGAGPAADVYSLGLVLLEALKAELEYGGTPLEAAIARLHRPPVIPPELPDGLAGLLRAMTAVDEADRPDAHTCCRALSAFAAAEPGAPAGPLPAPDHGPDDRGAEHPAVSTTRQGAYDTRSAPRVSTGRRSHRGHRAHRVLLTAGSTLAALGVALTGSTGGLPADGGDAAARPPRPATTEPATPATGAPGRPSSSHAAPDSPVSADRTPAGAVGTGTTRTGAGGVGTAKTGAREAGGAKAVAVRGDAEAGASSRGPAAPAASRDTSGVPWAQNAREPSHDRGNARKGQGNNPHKGKGKD
ncbi:serine/threonine-protein kinase [Streptomyces lavendofoliae]|uniref:serine/threonine-protein kinase n=1 Tax=Streptomyces lavendofoliae TaxID=67314 RepID=UPI00300F5AB9